MVSPSGMIGYFGAASYHACHCEEAVRRGPQGSAACGLRATAASGGGKGAKKLGSHLALRKQRAAQSLSGNPEESSDRSVQAGTCLCTNEVQGKGLVPTRKSQGSIVQRQSPIHRCQEIATGLTALAMTEEIGTQAQTIDHICHCEAPTGPWQSVLRAGSSGIDQLPKERIAASASPPRNDMIGSPVVVIAARFPPPFGAIPQKNTQKNALRSCFLLHFVLSYKVKQI